MGKPKGKNRVYERCLICGTKLQKMVTHGGRDEAVNGPWGSALFPHKDHVSLVSEEGISRFYPVSDCLE